MPGSPTDFAGQNGQHNGAGSPNNTFWEHMPVMAGNQPTERLRMAAGMVAQGNFPPAIQICDQLLLENQTNAGAYYIRAEAYRLLGQVYAWTLLKDRLC